MAYKYCLNLTIQKVYAYMFARKIQVKILKVKKVFISIQNYLFFRILNMFPKTQVSQTTTKIISLV